MRRFLSLVIFTPLTAIVVDAFLDRHQSGASTRIVSVVGRWLEQTIDGASVIRGEGVAGVVTDADANAAAASLFGKVDAAFVANATNPAAFALAVLPDVKRFAAGTFSASFNLVSGASDQTAGLVFDLQPSGEYFFVRYNTKDGNLALWRYADGKRAIVAHGEQKQQLSLGTWHQLAVTIAGTRVTGLVDGKLRLEHNLERPPTGRVGFWTKRDSVTMFKDVAVRPE